MTELDPPDRCPTPTGHRRLEEVHRFWHECLAGYQDPEEFRIKLNACIQAVRNTTFAIQKEKNRVAEFDAWYALWQGRMKDDPIMTWLNEARVTIVHAGDLDTHSVARVRLIGGYEDATAAVLSGLPVTDVEGLDDAEFEVSSPGLPLGRIVAEVEASALPRRYIERRWVDSKLPTVELLEALAYAYGFLGRMVDDAHARAGLEHGVAVEHDGRTVRLEVVPGHGGRLACMVTTRAIRTLNLSMKDGQVSTGGKSWFMTPDRPHADLAEAARRYKLRRCRGQRYVARPAAR